VAVVSKADAAGGGASRVAQDLSSLLNTESPFRSHHWLSYAGGEWQPNYRSLWGGRKSSFIYKAAAWISIQAGFPDFFTPELLIHNWKKDIDYDIYHFHDISRTFSPISMRWLSKRCPVVWTFHDCSAFTGGCLYPMGCEAFKTRCGNCPQLDLWPLKTKIDATGLMYNFKKETASAKLFIPIAPSQWMADEAMKSGMFDERPRVIPYSVDTDFFRMLSVEMIRDILLLPQDRFIVLLNVHNIADARKGVADAIEAIQLVNPRPLVVALGTVDPESKKLFRNIDTRFLGYVSDRHLLSQYCSAADVLLFPTYADNLPNAVLESMASGTPTIGYSTGGMPDMVEHGLNGWLAETGDIKGLSEGLSQAQSSPVLLQQWSIDCRKKAESQFSKLSFVRAHTSLYDEIIYDLPGLLPHLAV